MTHPPHKINPDSTGTQEDTPPHGDAPPLLALKKASSPFTDDQLAHAQHQTFSTVQENPLYSASSAEQNTQEDQSASPLTPQQLNPPASNHGIFAESPFSAPNTAQSLKTSKPADDQTSYSATTNRASADSTHEDPTMHNEWPSYPFPTKEPWRKQHPVLFWGSLLLLLFFSGKGIQWMMEKGPLSGPKIGIVHIKGMILDSSSIVEWIDTLQKDPMVKGVLLRINSPGGAVEPSEEIYMAVTRLARTKPVVVSMGAVAASGGYYIALGGNKIFAGPSTLTASIGVKLQIPNTEGLMRMIGLSEKTLTTGALKDAGSPMREMTPDEEAYFRELINDMYEGFVETVMANRKLSREVVLALADGRAMTGRQAQKAGLIDSIGDSNTALLELLAQSKITPSAPYSVLEGPEEPGSFLRDLMGAALHTYQNQQAITQSAQFMYR